MKNKKHDIFDVALDEEERELSEAIDQVIDKGKLKRAGKIKELFLTKIPCNLKNLLSPK